MSDSELTNIDIALYALYDLGGHEKKVHTEEVAYRAYELAEERFGWRLPRFREKHFPDKEPVRIALMDAAKLKYGQLVEGRSGVEAKGKDIDGWFFTPAGAAWIRDNVDRIQSALRITRPKASPKDAERFRKYMRSQELFAQYKEGNLTGENSYALRDMLEVSPDAPRDMLLTKFRRLQTNAALVRDQEIINFLDECSSAFSGFLTPEW